MCTARFQICRPTPWDTTINKVAGIGQIGHLFHISIEPKPFPGVFIIGATLYPQHGMLIIKNPKAKLESTDPRRPEPLPIDRLLFEAIVQHPRKGEPIRLKL